MGGKSEGKCYLINQVGYWLDVPELRTKETSLYPGWNRGVCPVGHHGLSLAALGSACCLRKTLKMEHMRPLQTSTGTPHPTVGSKVVVNGFSYFQETRKSILKHHFLFVLVINYGPNVWETLVLPSKWQLAQRNIGRRLLCFLSRGPFPSFPCANLLLSACRRRVVSIPRRLLEPCRFTLLPTLSLFIMRNKNLKYLYPITRYIFKQK